LLGWAALSFLIGGLEALPALHVAFHGLWGPHRHGVASMQDAEPRGGDADPRSSSPEKAPLDDPGHGDGSLSHHRQATVPPLFAPRVAFVALAELPAPDSPAVRAPEVRPRRRREARAPPQP
jgi:hypothetical protein